MFWADQKLVNYTYLTKWDQTLKECSWVQLTKNKIANHVFVLSLNTITSDSNIVS